MRCNQALQHAFQLFNVKCHTNVVPGLVQLNADLPVHGFLLNAQRQGTLRVNSQVELNREQVAMLERPEGGSGEGVRVHQ